MQFHLCLYRRCLRLRDLLVSPSIDIFKTELSRERLTSPCKTFFENGTTEKLFYKDSVKIIYNKNGTIQSKTNCKTLECYCKNKENSVLSKNLSETLYNSKREAIGKVFYKDGKKVIEMSNEYNQQKLRNIYFIDDTIHFNDSLIKKIKH